MVISNGMPLRDDLRSLAESLSPYLRVIETVDKETPGKARNQGLAVSQGDWIFFLDDDAYLLPHYWETISPYLQEPTIDVIGGPDTRARGMGAFANALGIALASPFCTGTTFARHFSLGKKLIIADEEKLSSCNLWVRRKAFGELTFAEEYRRTEESYFLQELKKLGRSMYYHPRLIVAHHRRDQLRELFKPTFFAGFYRSRLLRKKLSKGGEVYALPTFFCLLHLLVFFDPFVFWSLVQVYLGIIGCVSIGLAARAGKVWLFPLVVFFHYFIVFMYGLGFLAERFTKSRV